MWTNTLGLEGLENLACRTPEPMTYSFDSDYSSCATPESEKTIYDASSPSPFISKWSTDGPKPWKDYLISADPSPSFKGVCPIDVFGIKPSETMEKREKDEEEEEEEEIPKTPKMKKAQLPSPPSKPVKNAEKHHELLGQVLKEGSNCTRKLFESRKKRFPAPAIAILRKFYLENHYPTEKEMKKIKRKTGLSLGQISSWMSNARQRGITISKSRIK